MNCSRPSVKHNEELILFLFAYVVMRIWSRKEYSELCRTESDSSMSASRSLQPIATKTVILRLLVLNPPGRRRARAELHDLRGLPKAPDRVEGTKKSSRYYVDTAAT